LRFTIRIGPAAARALRTLRFFARLAIRQPPLTGRQVNCRHHSRRT
jgi:hypothetical protein